MKLGREILRWTLLQWTALTLAILLIAPAPLPAQDQATAVAPASGQPTLTCWAPVSYLDGVPTLDPKAATRILPFPCGVGNTQLSSSIVNSIYAFEDKGLTDYLQANDLPTSHEEFYKTAGKDLRTELRAFLLAKFITIAKTSPAQRSAQDTDVFNWVLAFLTDVEKKVYASAHLENLKYIRDPCGYVIDSTIGPAFNVIYDSTNCYNYGNFFAPPRQPSAEYYLAIGANTTYKSLTSDPIVAATVTTISPLVELFLSLAVAGGLVTGAAVGTSYAAVAPFAARAALDLAEAGGEAAGEALGAVGTGAGVVGIVVAALLVLIQGSIDFANAQKVIDGLASFNSQYQATIAPGYQFDVVSAVSDSAQSWKLTAVWSKLSSVDTDLYPDVSLAPQAVLISHGLLPILLPNSRFSYSDVYVPDTEQGGDHFTTVDWEGRLWRVTLYGNRYFSKTCLTPGSKKDATGKLLYPCYGPEISRTLETVYPTNSFITAAVDMSNRALVARNGDNKFFVRIFGSANFEKLPADHDCPANPTTGVSDKAWELPTCTSFTSDYAFFLTTPDFYTGPVIVTDPFFSRVRILAPPTITAAPTVGFQLGQASSFNLGATSTSLPSVPINITNGVCPGDPFHLDDGLPSSIAFISGTVGTARIAYNGAVPGPNDIVLNGPFNIHFCARQQIANSSVSRTASLQISLGNGSRILSSTQPTIYWGVPFSFKIYASGDPLPSLTINNLALNDVEHMLTFQDNHDGSATLSGTFPYGYNLVPNGFFQGKETSITASNGITSDTKLLAINAVPAPPPTVSFPDLTFEAGQFRSHTITTSGALVTPAFFAYPATATVSTNPNVVVPVSGPTHPLPEAPWLTFQDNRDGTATLSGTPPMLSAIDVPLKFVTTASYVTPLVSPITLTMQANPYFTNSDTAIFTVGTQGSFPLAVANNGRAGTFGGLPPGLFLSNNTISGTPATGSAGRYTVSLLSTNGFGASGQTLTVYITERPSLYANTPQQNSIVVQAGIKTKIVFSAGGYPKTPPPLGSPVALGTGMSITATNNTIPPAYYTFSDKNSAGKVYGGAVLTMNPPANVEGLYALTLTADNGVPSPSTLNLAIRVVKPGDVNQDSLTNCLDINIIKNSLGRRNGQPGYDPRADVNLDQVVDVKDLSFVASRLAAGTICQ